MRHRVEDQRSPCTIVQTTYNLACTGVTNVFNLSAGQLGSWRETWDVETPNFRKRMRAGEIIVNGYSHAEEHWYNSGNGIIQWGPPSCPNGSWGTEEFDGPHLTLVCESNPLHGRLRPSWVLTQDEVNRTTDLAATKAWASSIGNDAQILVFLAELKKTIRMLVHPIENFSRFLDKVRRDKVRDPRSAVKALTVAEYLAMEWLTYRFGVRPLLSDIQSIVKAIHRPRKTGRTRAKGFAALERTSTVRKTIDWGRVRVTYDLVTTHKLEVRCGFIYDAELNTRDFLGFQFKNIPDTVWELISYSFVVDWFFNIGDWVKALTAYASTPTLGAFTSSKHSITVQRIHVSTVQVVFDGWTLKRPMSGTETLVYSYKGRTPSIPPPSITRKVDFSDFDLSDLRILDALALVKQKLGAR